SHRQGRCEDGARAAAHARHRRPHRHRQRPGHHGAQGPSFIVTLGTMLVIHGGIMWWTGGSATGDPAESFRSIGRGGIDGVPVLELIPYAVLILLAVVL